MGVGMIELSELRDAAQQMFPASELMPPRDESWQQVAELGWLMLDLPEDLDGLALGREALATVLLEMGKALPAAPLAPALLGLQALVSAPELPDREGWIARICGGEYVPLNVLPAQVERTGDALTGTIPGLFEADLATHVLADTGELYALIPLNAPGVRLVEHQLWDESRRLFDVQLENYQLNHKLILSEGPAAKALHDELAITAQLAIAADCLGGADAVLTMTIDYLATRRQFDRPLAMFQALKHRVADLKVALTGAEALFWNRLAGAPTVLEMGAMKAHCAQVFRDVAEEAIQLHGGIGLTQEHPCHLFFKRAFLNCQLCGGIEHWEEQVGRAALSAR